MEKIKEVITEEIIVSDDKAEVVEEILEEGTTPAQIKEAGRGRNFNSDRSTTQNRFDRPRPKKEFEEVVVAINRITKVTKGGRRMRFAALVVVGDKKGRIGFGKGKSVEVPDAIKKAVKQATKNVITIKLTKSKTIPHEITGKWGSSRVLLKPAKTGTGIVAGGAIRAVVELAGVQDIYTKNLGSKAPINKVRATLNGLTSIRLPKDFIHIRSRNPKNVDETK